MSVQKPVKTSLPALPASAAPDMRMYLERVREELSRIQAGSSTTTVISSGGSSSGTGGGGGGGSGGGGGGVDPTTLPCGDPVTPTAPTNFQVTAGFNFFMVEWDLPTYCGHSHTEVYGTKDDGAQGTEVLLGTTGGTIFSLAEPNTGVRRCFWAKHVNLVGVKGPYNGTEGTCDTTALDPGHLIEVLTGQITETQLYKDLGEKIELLPEFDAAITDLNTATGELHEITDELHEITDELAIGVTHLEEVTATQATTIDGIKVASDNATAAIVQINTVSVDSTSANARQVAGLTASVGTAQADIVAINTVSVDSTSANARQVAGLTASVGTAQADIVAINTVSVDSTSANARHLAGLTVQYNDLNATVVNQGIAFANADQALAQQIDGVEALAQTGPALRPNLHPNSNFEQGMEGIRTNSPTAYIEAGWGLGRVLVMNNVAPHTYVFFPAFTVYGGQRFLATLDVAINGAQPNAHYSSFLRFHTGPNIPIDLSTWVTWSHPPIFGNRAWSDDPARRADFLVDAVAPPGAVYACLGFYLRGANVNQVALRRPQVVPGAPPMSPYSSEAAGSQTAARVINVETARIGYCSKNGETTADGTKEACQANGGTWNVGLPWATAVKQVSVTYNGQTVSLQQQFEAISTDTGGLKAQYSVKIDNNGLVSGFGLASEPVIGGSTSAFGVRADRFWIAVPEDTNSPNSPPGRLPFIVTTTGQWIDDEYFPPGVYMQEAFINAATISRARIKNLAVDTAKIQDAAITNAKIQDASISNAKIQDAAITNAKINNASIGTAKIVDLAVTNAKIGDLAVDTLKIAGNAVTAASYYTTTRGSGTATFQLGMDYYTNLLYTRLSPIKYYYHYISGMNSGETAATIIMVSVSLYPVKGSTDGNVIAVGLFVDDVYVSGVSQAIQGDPMLTAFGGLVYLANGGHKIQVTAIISEYAYVGDVKLLEQSDVSVTIMSGKR